MWRWHRRTRGNACPGRTFRVVDIDGTPLRITVSSATNSRSTTVLVDVDARILGAYGRRLVVRLRRDQAGYLARSLDDAVAIDPDEVAS